MESDVFWVEAARGGNQIAFGHLVRRYQRPVYSLCLRMLRSPNEAEDAAQETFLKAYRALESYDEARSFSTWLLAIASHHCIDRLRRRRVTEVSLDALPPWRWLPGRSVDPEAAAARAEQADNIGQLLASLPSDYRLVIVLRYWHDLGYAEIAELLGDTESAIKSRLHRARRLLASAMDGGPGELVPVGASEPMGVTTNKGEMAWTVAQPAI